MVCFKAFEMKQARIIQALFKVYFEYHYFFFPLWVDESNILCSFFFFCLLIFCIKNSPFINGFIFAVDAYANNKIMQNGLCDRDNFIVNIFYSHFL